MTILAEWKKKQKHVFLNVRSADWYIITTVSVALFTDTFLYGMLVPVMPFALVNRAGIDESDIQTWSSILLAVYGASWFLFSPIFGYLADVLKTRQITMLVGLGIFIGSTLMLCLARTIWLLVLGRVFQGIAAAVVWSSGLALLVDTVGPERIGLATGYVTLGISGGIFIAPLLGGIVYAQKGYYAVFGMAFGLLALDIALRLSIIEKRDARHLNQTSQPIFLESEKEIPDPTERGTSIPKLRPNNEPKPKPVGHIKVFAKRTFRLLRSTRLLAALWGILIQGSLLTSLDGVLPLHVEETFNWGPTLAGLIFLPIVIPGIAEPYIGALTDRHGPRYLATAGFALGAPFLILLRFVTHNSPSQIVILCVLLFLIGGSISSVVPPLMVGITRFLESVEEEEPGVLGEKGAYAQAYGFFSMSFALGTTVGPVFAGLIRDHAGWGTMGWALGVVSGFSAGVMWLFLVEKKGKSRERDIGETGVVQEV
ncbi:MFS general substrate transporter [Patellaria atrata CBS 101060]|uniref:MFS general substrate transporter n=1 Tax=Patellaria atrata CBS 101060 TaxID=1346257 RepID=A0A9P4SHW5_9PEZI|nr:MFS general substrate transporter [Patellaria atrata CBS 101060]